MVEIGQGAETLCGMPLINGVEVESMGAAFEARGRIDGDARAGL